MEALSDILDSTNLLVVIALVMVGAAVFTVRWLRQPSRRYEGPESVAQIYDDWAMDRFMAYYWGGHLHAGYYGDPPERKDFVRAKEIMVDEMLRWGLEAEDGLLRERLQGSAGARVMLLDVGCGMGETVLQLAPRWPEKLAALGVTLSEAQARRGAMRMVEEGIENARFMVGDALALPYPEASFDIVWTLEAEPHIPDNEMFVREMVRILKPGGVLVMGTWNVRDDREQPLSERERESVRFLLDEWNHAKFSSIPACVALMEGAGLQDVVAADWTVQTVPTWRESVVAPYRRPGLLMELVWSQFSVLIRNAYTLLRYDRAFREGLLVYGVFRGKKAHTRLTENGVDGRISSAV